MNIITISLILFSIEKFSFGPRQANLVLIVKVQASLRSLARTSAARFRRACASAQSRQNLLCSLIQVVSQEEPSDRKPDPWPLWMAGHAQLKFVMTECSTTQTRLTLHIWNIVGHCILLGIIKKFSNQCIYPLLLTGPLGEPLKPLWTFTLMEIL